MAIGVLLTLVGGLVFGIFIMWTFKKDDAPGASNISQFFLAFLGFVITCYIGGVGVNQD